MEFDDFKTMLDSYDDILQLLEQHEIPEEYPPSTDDLNLFGGKSLGMESLFVREKVIDLAGFCFLAYKWIRPLANWIGERRCLEVMGGSGALSKGLQNCGVNILCTDNYAWKNSHAGWFDKPWTNVEQIDAVGAVRKYAKSTDLVLCSWPYLGPSCFEVLKTMREVIPNAMMIYIGERNSAVNADELFFDEAILVNDPAFEAAVSGYRSAQTIKDWPVLLK